MPTFPAGRFDNLNLLTETIPSFWVDLFGGGELVADLLRGATLQEQQLDQQVSEFADSIDRTACPVWHTDLWYPLELAQSEGVSASYLQYGDDLIYGPQLDTSISYQFGQPLDTSWEFPLPAEVIRCQLIADGLVAPQLLLVQGADFLIDSERQRLIFFTDPFLHPGFQPYTDDAGVVRLRLYLLAAQLDWDYVPNLYGSLIGLKGKSTECFKELTNAVLDGITTGSTRQQLTTALEALTDVPFAKGTELVEVITTDATGLLVITDQQVYRLVSDSVLTVAVGDTLTVGQPLSDAVCIYEPGNGQIPEDLEQLAVGTGLLWPSAQGELIFANATVPLTVQTGVSGYTKVSFPLGGFPDVVSAFFTEVHARGVADSKTLANYLDLRDTPVTQPTALHLPTTINPLQFLLENLLRANLLLVRAKVRYFGPHRAGIDKAGILRRLIPPHVALILIVELAEVADEFIMVGDGDETSPGYLEEYEINYV